MATFQEALDFVVQALEKGATRVAQEYFGRSASLPAASRSVFDCLTRVRKALDAAAAAATLTEGTPTSGRKRTAVAAALDAAEDASASETLQQDMDVEGSHSDGARYLLGVPDEYTVLQTASSHTTVGFKRPWVTLQDGHPTTIHMSSAAQLRACWARVLRELLVDARGQAVALDTIALPAPLRLELALHMLQCGAEGAVVLNAVHLRRFLDARMDEAPWYGQYVNQFMLVNPVELAMWPALLAQTMSGYPLSVLMMLSFLRDRGQPRTPSFDASHLALPPCYYSLPPSVLEEYGALLRLRHSITMRRFERETDATRELAQLIEVLQARFGLAEQERRDYAALYSLDESHLDQYHRKIRQPMQLHPSEPSAHEAVNLARLAVSVRHRLREYYPRDNLSFSMPRVYGRLGVVFSLTPSCVSTVDTSLMVYWFASVRRWAVCAHLLLMDSDQLSFRAFPACRVLSLFKTLARMESMLGERCIDRWLVAPSPFHAGECLMVATPHFWRRFQVRQSQVYLSASQLPCVWRSKHADMFQLVRALLCGDDYTVVCMFANVLISYMTVHASEVAYVHMRGRCNYYRYLPHVLRTLFGSSQALIDAFQDTTLYVPQEECLLGTRDPKTGDRPWIGLPEHWRLQHAFRGHAHRPHIYYALLAFLSTHRVRYVHRHTLEEVQKELITRGVFHRYGKLGLRRHMPPFPDDSPDGMFYAHVDEWMHQRLGRLGASDWVELYDEDITYKHVLHATDKHLRIDDCWYQLCCDEAALAHETRMQMFFCMCVDGPIRFPDRHHNVVSTDCRESTEWIGNFVNIGASFGTGAAQFITAAEEERLMCMNDYYLRQCMREPSAYNDTLWHPRHIRVWPVYDRISLEMVVTLVCLLRDGMIYPMPPPYAHETSPWGTLAHIISDPVVKAQVKSESEVPRFESVTHSAQAVCRFTAMSAPPRDKHALSWARRFGLMFMEELRGLLVDSATQPPCGMAYQTATGKPERVGTQVVVLLNDDMVQYSTNPDSPANAPSNHLLAEASMFTRYQRSHMARGLQAHMTPQEQAFYASAGAAVQSHKRQAAPDDDPLPYADPLDDGTPLSALPDVLQRWPHLGQ